MALKEFRIALTIIIMVMSLLMAMLGIVSEELDWAWIGLTGMCISGYGLHIWIYKEILVTDRNDDGDESMAVERMKMTE